MLEGVDVSYYQGYIDWHTVKLNGKRFAFMKATEGIGYQDTTFPYNWEQSRNNGLVRGAYHYLHPSIDGALQADYLHQYVHDNGRFVNGDFVVLDIEETDGMDAVGVLNACAAFVERCLREIHKNVILYTSPSFWIDTLGNPTDSVLAACPLWLADYGVQSLPTLANWPNGVSFWQYSDTGHVPGIQGEVDLNRFYGNRQQLTKLSMVP